MAAPEEIEALRNIARNAGLAFQIQDDLLDMTAIQSDFGKKIGKDVIEGKKTFLILTALQLAESQEDKELLNEFMNNNGLQEEQIPELDNLFKKYGVYNLAQNEIDNYFEKAGNSYKLLKKNVHTEMLAWLLSSLNKRVV